MAIFTIPKVAITLIALYIARRVYWEATTGARRRSIAKQNGCLPPRKVPLRDPIFGLDLLYSNIKAHSDNRLLEAWSDRLKSQERHTVVMPILGNNIYLTDDPENIKSMLATNFNSWSLGRERIKMMASFLGYGIFCTEGAAWKHSRDMLRPCFERSQVADVDMMEKHVKCLIDQIPDDGKTIDLQPLFHHLSMDIATEFLFGRSTNAQDPNLRDEDVEHFVEAIEYCSDPFSNDNIKRWGFIGAFLPDPKHAKCAKVLRDFADKYLDAEIASRSTSTTTTPPKDRYSFLDTLLSATQDRTTIRSELLNILLAGRDTTASLLSNLFFELTRHPSKLARLRHEISTHIGSSQPTYDTLKQLKYLRAIINETQRLYPVVPSNSRETLIDTVLPRGGGPTGASPILIPKGSFVAYHSYSLQRRKDIYGEDAEEFVPERWMPDEHSSAPLRPGWAYLAFSGGPRVCIGQNFAITEAGYVVVRLLQTFGEVESRDEGVWREKLTITCIGAGGCKLGLRRELETEGEAVEEKS
ncbi:putative P450 monooxygenase [Aaosphaeria arxii CBS 175.79]|uniref:Putative P450 monooxygenase n=1 Tax=Aaosphaeria arxii CBS 175.79 TaxID=1450172 RepID=A0A6A5XWA4_9PLEO|nr:putative P450 monooxygenase [Aaosphaeria arxii CBS 175.79]KAF2016991.1 putative P450 monooxygenase [Aaosphaeria arxii CBS 175.79]